jgi:hypothetical protein
MGGPCSVSFHGNTADEVIKAEDAHLREMVAKGDQAHTPALARMKASWKNPLSGMKWYIKTKSDFAALPEDT